MTGRGGRIAYYLVCTLHTIFLVMLFSIELLRIFFLGGGGGGDPLVFVCGLPWNIWLAEVASALNAIM